MKKIKLYNVLLLISSLIYTVVLILLTDGVSQIIELITDGKSVSNSLSILTIIYLIIYLISLYLTPVAFRIISRKAEGLYNSYYIKKLFNQDISFYINNNQGYINKLINDVVPAYSYYKVSYIPNLVCNLASIIGYLIYIFIKNYIMGLILVLMLVVLLIFSMLLSKKMADKYQKSKEASANTDSKFLELVQNYFSIRSINEQDEMTNIYLDNYKKEKYKANYEYDLIEGLYMGLFMTLTFAVPIVLLVIGIVFKNVFAISVGGVVSIYALSGNLQEPIRQVSTCISDYKNNKENKKMLESFKTIDSKPVINSYSYVSFKSKGVTYQNKEILKNVDFNIEKGKNYLLKGESGSGKSSIFRFILGFDKSDNVNVIIDDKSINDINPLKVINSVSQDNAVFKETIKFNITLGKSYTDEDINEVIDVCCLKEFISNYGLDKVIDNQDSNISGGEKQRICLARVLIRKAPLILLDEVTSSLDPNTSLTLANNIDKYIKKYNINYVAISHKNEFDNLNLECINL